MASRPGVLCRGLGYGALWGGNVGALTLLAAPELIPFLWVAWAIGAVIGAAIGLVAATCLFLAPLEVRTSPAWSRAVAGLPAIGVPAIAGTASGLVQSVGNWIWLGVFCLVSGCLAVLLAPRVVRGKRRRLKPTGRG